MKLFCLDAKCVYNLPSFQTLQIQADYTNSVMLKLPITF